MYFSEKGVPQRSICEIFFIDINGEISYNLVQSLKSKSSSFVKEDIGDISLNLLLVSIKY